MQREQGSGLALMSGVQAAANVSEQEKILN